MFDFIRSLFGRAREHFAPPRFGVPELAQRLGINADDLKAVRLTYASFTIPKRSGGLRTILAPSPELKHVQKRIHQRLLRRLRAHPNATGFECGHSIVTNALPHCRKDVVIRLDLKDFFTSTKADRVHRYFRFIGYDEPAAALLTRLCTYKGSLPQGAPTSPRLSNLVNHRLDTRLAALAANRGLSYSRYADDITFSGSKEHIARALDPSSTGQRHPSGVVHAAKCVIADEGYRLHMRRKLRVYHRHHRQMVTGLVVNEKPSLPRTTRRWLRAIEHHLRTGRSATLSEPQLAGWKSLQHMIAGQGNTN